MASAHLQRGDVWLLRGDAADPARKPGRPLLVVSRDPLNRGDRVVCVPFYSQQLEKRKPLSYCVAFSAGEGGLAKDCVAKCDEIAMIDKTAIDLRRGRIGRLNASQMEQIVKAIRYVIRDDAT